MDDWQVSDLALCVDDTRHANSIDSPWRVQKGVVYTVSLVGSDALGVWLQLAEDPFPVWTMDAAWCASRFRKIKPLTEEERRSFLADLPQPVEA